MIKDYNDIKNNIKKSKKLIYWLNNKGDIILTDENKNISKVKIKNMKNITGLLYRFHLTFHTGQKPGQGGPLAINIRLFEKNGNNILKVSGYKNGIIWIAKNYLERRGWKENFINLIFNIVSKKTFEFKIRIYILHQLL